MASISSRLLGAVDLARLGAVLRLREDENPVCVAAVRLLLLTECGAGEIRCLRWCEVKPDRLALIDAKMGPRHVLLGEAARELLEGLAASAVRGVGVSGRQGRQAVEYRRSVEVLDQGARRDRNRGRC